MKAFAEVTHLRQSFIHDLSKRKLRDMGILQCGQNLDGKLLVNMGTIFDVKETNGVFAKAKARTVEFCRGSGRSASLPVLPVSCQNWQTDNWTTKILSTPPRPIHRWKALGETVTTVILHGGVLYYNLS
jgi:hypothetical protein